MSDGGKSGLTQVTNELQESIVKPVVDEVGKAIEEGVQAVLGSGPMAVRPQDPAVEQKKKQEEAQRKQWALKVIDWNRKLQEAQTKVRQENQQQQMQQQQEEVEQKKVKQFKIIEKKQKQQQQLTQAQMAERKTELKKGVGG